MSRAHPFGTPTPEHPDPAVAWWMRWCRATRNRVELHREQEARRTAA